MKGVVPTLYVLLRAASGLLGCALLITAIFLREDEEGRIQSRLELLWIRIDDARKYSLPRHTAVVRVITAFISSGFDRLFGTKLFSKRAVGTSICYVIASIFLIALCVAAIQGEAEGSDYINPILILFGLIIYGTLPAVIKKPLWGWFWFVPVLAIVAWLSITTIRSIMSPRSYSELLVAYLVTGLILGCALSILFIVVIRRALRGISAANSITRILFTSAICFLPMAALSTIGLYYSVKHPFFDAFADLLVADILNQMPIPLGHILAENLDEKLMAGFANGITALIVIFIVPASIFILLAILLLLHSLLWPVLDRPVYALQRWGVVRRNKVLGLVGLELLGIALGYDLVKLIKDILSAALG